MTTTDSDLASQYQAIRTSAALSRPARWGLVHVFGPDTYQFLQSLVSQDLDPLSDGDGAHSLLLQPQGKLTADFRLLRVDAETAWLDCETAAAPALATGLDRFRIRIRAEVADRTDDTTRLAIRGPDAAGIAYAALAVEVPDREHGHVQWRGARVVRSDWPTVAGVDVVGEEADVHSAFAAIASIGATIADDEVFEVARIEAGIARQGLDVDDATIAQEAFLEKSAVSFTKGCFVGQELVCRIDTRGHVNRFLRLLRLTDGVPAVGDAVIASDHEVGSITSAAAHPLGGAVALAMLRREVEPPTEVVVRTASGEVPASVDVLPGR